MPRIPMWGMALLAALLGLCACQCGKTGELVRPPPRPAAPLPAAVTDTERQNAWLPEDAVNGAKGGANSAARGAGAIWWEAETPQATDFPPQHPFEPENAEQASRLSAGKWIGADNPGKLLFLEYEVNVPEGQRYDFYVRKFWQHGPFRWRFGEQQWQACGRNMTLLDGVSLRAHVGANWVPLGSVSLGAGKHLLRIELLDPKGAAVFDAFVLSPGTFVPRGKLKPDEQFTSPLPGWSVFDPPSDSFVASALDLRNLNQTRAGEAGFVTVRGSELVFEKTQQPVRFWGINAGNDVLSLSPELMRRYARHLAKFGVNLVRLHGPVFRQEAFREVDEAHLDAILRFTDALREQGIYLGVSLYFPAWLELTSADGIEGYQGKRPVALNYFNEEFQRAERSWWQRLLTKVNPETGLALAKDPALAYVELLNEDSTLFWTFSPYDTIPEPQIAGLERRFGAWLTNKYGTLNQAFDVWGKSDVRGDDAAQGRAGFMGLWNIANEPSARGKDTARFLTELMREHYTRLQSTIKGELGYPGLTVCSNWITADERVLGPLDNWANLVCDVMDRHAYVSGPHEGDAAGYSVQSGHMYDDRSALRVSEQKGDEHSSLVPAFLEPRLNGKPAFVSELGWTWPNRFRAEGPLLTAAYGRLVGLDSPMWFASTQPFWANALGKFEVKDPVIFGQFPAAALLFRRGLVAEAAPVGNATLSEAELFSLVGAPISPVPGLDALRKQDVTRTSSASGTRTPMDPLSLLVGPVDLWLGAERAAAAGQTPAQPVPSSLEPWINRAQGTVKSHTEQLRWDFNIGLVKINAPSVNAAIGFVAHEGPVQLSQMSISVRNDFAAIALVALDDAPLETARRLLLQVATEATNSGFSAPGADKRSIAAAGDMPILLRDVDGVIRLNRPDAGELRVTALDANGAVQRRARFGADKIVLLPDTPYYLIEHKLGAE